MTATAESTASLQYDDLMKELAERAGYGYREDQAAGLSSDQETELLMYLHEGYRQFLMVHDWSFMRPVTTSVLWPSTLATTTMVVSGAGNTTITASASTFFPTMVGHSIVSTAASYVITAYTSATVVTVATDASADTGLAFQVVADGSYRMPDDFGGLLGEVFFNAGDGRWYPLTQVGVAEILEMQMVTSGTGRPTTVAIDPQPVTTGDTVGQRHNMLAFRTADSEYTVRYQYQILPDKLVTNDFPYGGAMHAETIKYGAYAAMERSKLQLTDGPLEKHYQKLVRMSVRKDNRGTRADSLGFMVDAQAGNRYRTRYLPFAQNITVGGTSFP